MYVEPRDTLREYVQNAFDAIEAARSDRTLLPSAGGIKIIISSEGAGSITIEDDGASIRPDLVWNTLTSIGASRKSPRRQAGFRGIGRLAGIAYCERLEFSCKAAGFQEEVTVSYNCKAIRDALLDATDLESVFTAHISETRTPAPDPAAHYTKVRLVDLTVAPSELTNIGSIAAYLRVVSPLRFSDSFGDYREQILAEARARGMEPQTVRLFIGASENTLDELFKPYARATVANKKPAPIRKISFFEGGTVEGARWWGWHGETPLYGLISDQDVAGIRVRVKNIQLDGTDILARIMRNQSLSYERFQFWVLGEIFIETLPGVLIPNARRDGFEDSPAWREMQDQIRDTLKDYIGAVYKASGARSSKRFEKVKENADREIEDIQAVLQTDPPAPPTPEVGNKIRAALRKIDGLNLSDYTEDQQVELRKTTAALKDLARQASVTLTEPKPQKASAKTAPEPEYPAYLEPAFEVLASMLDTKLYQSVRKAIIKRYS
jgi:molecular chaperone HtpG